MVAATSLVGRCGTCQHWGTDTENQLEFSQRTCLMISKGGGQIGSIAAGPSSRFAFLNTSSMFGCVFHEPQEENHASS